MSTKTARKYDWNAGLATLIRLVKNLPRDTAEDLMDIVDINSDVADGINANYVNRVPGRAEIPVSPVTAASGGGAESLIEWSSDLSPQEGITRLYDAFSKLLKRFDELGKSQLRLAEGVAAFVKATDERFPDSESDEDDDSDEAQIEKALAGAGIRTGAIRDVLAAVRSHRASVMPPSFTKSTLAKAEDEVDLDSLTQEEYIRYQSAKNALALAASGQKIDHDVLAKAARTVANPSGGPSAYDVGAAAGRAGI